LYIAELWVPVVGQGTIEGQFKERGSGRWKGVNPRSCGARHFPEKKKKKRLSNQEEKLEGIKEWENRKAEGSFGKRESVSRKPHCCKTMMFY
jgi:hypothetical protein